MNDNKKNNLFSWINSKIIKRNKIDLNKCKIQNKINTKDFKKLDNENNIKMNFFF